ncbi:MAG: helix-turn-helix transcriptional regulator [Actinomycetota bacterium]|nr:helix-turn-helix transcriptional regulator [Actinomycetota bacterium]
MPTHTEPSTPALPRNFVRPCILLLLREHPAHGYDLLERLRVFGFSPTDPGRLYRALRALEADGLVRSAWEPSESGPNRRIYELTRAGMEELHDHAEAITSTSAALDRFLTRYEEFVALGRHAAGGDRLARQPL